MMTRIGIRSLYALAVAAALGFGATQSVASPGRAGNDGQACNRWYFIKCAEGAANLCANYCAQLGFANSSCEDDLYRPRSCCSCSN
jgi:hypothetical protein